ncbi:hypothetical protein CLV30_10547 [Haloactinopolyspora alba]|uniref:OLD protein-like TOPRIM domain-containing protein n=1 Tax=Haloactinopolyspora alba TaxID=648780 RepID=A0A2P8E531_9ACTN|nr:TOPRIM nucleotidyl transferase/hydrolase domain-containing protein [Haloactinopolyspora alba]PSL04584.1 hypothetical protein CLV30_10547 [Haloactinopolyspora alba]
MDIDLAVTTVVLVEGESDRSALESLAARRGRDLAGDGVAVVAMGGATNVGHYLRHFGPAGRGLEVAGLYDEAEERFFRNGLASAGLGDVSTRGELEALGFFVCVRDLEDELIRAVGVATVLELVADEGELSSFRVLQNQPAHRGRNTHDQLRRFIGTRAGRKIRYGRLLAEAVDLDRVPASLDGVLEQLPR